MDAKNKSTNEKDIILIKVKPDEFESLKYILDNGGRIVFEDGIDLKYIDIPKDPNGSNAGNLLNKWLEQISGEIYSSMNSYSPFKWKRCLYTVYEMIRLMRTTINNK